MEKLPFTISRLRPSERRQHSTSSHHRFPRRIAGACLAMIGSAAGADDLLSVDPGAPRTTLFSWAEIPPAPDQQPLAADVPDESVFHQLLEEPKTSGEGFWIRDQKWAAVFRMNNLSGLPAYAELISNVARAHPGGLASGMEWVAEPESITALAGLSLGGVFLLRYNGLRRKARLCYRDSRRVGSL